MKYPVLVAMLATLSLFAADGDKDKPGDKKPTKKPAAKASTSAPKPPALKDDFYTPSLEIAENFIRQNPPGGHYVLNVGQLTAPMDAAMRQFISSGDYEDLYVMSVPVTNLEDFPSLTIEERERFFQHLLPDRSLVFQRDLVVNFVVDDEAALEKFIPLMWEYRNKYRPSFTIHFNVVSKVATKNSKLQDIVNNLPAPDASSVLDRGEKDAVELVDLEAKITGRSNAPQTTLTHQQKATYVKTVAARTDLTSLSANRPIRVQDMTREGTGIDKNASFRGGATVTPFRPYLGDRGPRSISWSERYYKAEFKEKPTIVDIDSMLYGVSAFVMADRERQENFARKDRVIEDEVAVASLEHASLVMQEFPPDKFFVINFGIPATLTSAGLRVLIPDESARAKYYRELTVEHIRFLESYTLAERDAFWKKILPTPEELGGRQMVLHRTSWLGRSSSVIIPDLARYMRRQRPGEPMQYYYVYFDRKAGKRVETLFNENKDVFVDGAISEDHEYASTINLGDKLSQVTENIPTSVAGVMKEGFQWRPNPGREVVDERLRENLEKEFRAAPQMRAIAAQCNRILAQMLTGGPLPAEEPSEE